MEREGVGRQGRNRGRWGNGNKEMRERKDYTKKDGDHGESLCMQTLSFSATEEHTDLFAGSYSLCQCRSRVKDMRHPCQVH